MFDRLRHLWQSRESLDAVQWDELHGSVQRVLARARILDGQRQNRHELIHDFFVDKLLLGHSNAAPYDEAALLYYFKLYQYDRLPRRHEISMPPSEIGDLHDAAGCELGPQPDDALFLREREPRISHFFDSLSAEEKTLIALVQCEDHSVLEVEQLHAIRSGAYRAKKLGIVLSKSALPASWRETKLGRAVVVEMGIAVSAHNAPDLLQVFRLLCVKAASWWRTR